MTERVVPRVSENSLPQFANFQCNRMSPIAVDSAQNTKGLRAWGRHQLPNPQLPRSQLTSIRSSLPQSLRNTEFLRQF
jgi:hypothetical protein